MQKCPTCKSKQGQQTYMYIHTHTHTHTHTQESYHDLTSNSYNTGRRDVLDLLIEPEGVVNTKRELQNFYSHTTRNL